MTMKIFSTFLDSRSLLAADREPRTMQKVLGFRLLAGRRTRPGSRGLLSQLSDGIDSCASTVSLPAGHHQGASSFDRLWYNEEEIARGMAAKAGAEFFPVPIAPG